MLRFLSKVSKRLKATQLEITTIATNKQSFTFHSLKSFSQIASNIRGFNAKHASRKNNFQPSRFLQSEKVSPSGGINKQYLLYAVYGSFSIGGCMLIVFGINYFTKTVRRRVSGIEDERGPDGKKMDFIRYKGCVLPKFVEGILEKLKNFAVREDDVWVVSFPRSGTTWTQEMVYLINSDMNLEVAQKVSIEDRFPYLEYMTPGLDAIENMQSPRYIKSHLPYKLLPNDIEKAKIIYVARNPKDLVVSYYHFTKMLKVFDGEFEEFLDFFVNSKGVGYSPWSDHVLEFWQMKDKPNVLFLKYEDMMEDLEGTIKEVAKFLNKKVTEEDVKIIANHCSFKNMKTNEQVNYEWMRESGIWDKSDSKNTFMRKGKVGAWRKYFNEDTNYKVNRMVAYKFNGSDLKFRYDL